MLKFTLEDVGVMLSETPMDNVTKDLQKVVGGRLRQQNPVGYSEIKNPNLGKPCFSADQLEVKYAVDKQISVQ